MWCFNDILIVSQDLQLEYVHGYRGFDSRNNLHYINDGADIVFHAAGAGIVQNLSTGNTDVDLPIVWHVMNYTHTGPILIFIVL